MKVFLDGIPLVEPQSNLEKPIFEFQRNDETGDRAFSFTDDLTFTGPDYDYIYGILKSDSNAVNNKIVLRFENDCCAQNQVYEFYLTYSTLRWCEGECTLTVSAVEKSLSQDQFTCLKNTMIWDDTYNFKSKQHPRMSYCNELRPNWLHDLLIILTMIAWMVFLTLSPLLILVATIVTAINILINFGNAIINALNTLLPSGYELGNIDPIDLDGDPSTNAFQDVTTWVQNLLNSSFGCGRKHPSPLVRDYIENVCRKCGLAFQSTIYNDPNSDYYWAVYVNAPINKGTHEPDTTTYWIEENQPILSGLQFLDQLVILHNAKFDIVNSVLIFERRDLLVPKTPFLDLTTIDPSRIKGNICWNWSAKNRYSYANLTYQKDGINWVGSEAVARWSDIVEWNNPYNSNQKGEYNPLNPFAACRYRDDGIDRDVLTFYENLPIIGNLLRIYKNSMLMNSHNCFLPMIMIWDPASGTQNSTANKFTNIYHPSLAGIVGANQYYNYPYWFKFGVPGNLYDRFHAIEDPRSSGYQGLDFEATLEYDCDLLTDADVDGVVKTEEGNSYGPLRITVNFEAKTLTIKGTV